MHFHELATINPIHCFTIILEKLQYSMLYFISKCIEKLILKLLLKTFVEYTFVYTN